MRKNLIHKIIVFRNVFLLVILCNTNLFSQKDSTRFIDKFYLEFNGGVERVSYQYLYTAKDQTYWVDDSWFWTPLNVDLFFKNKFFKVGLSSNVLLSFDLKSKIGLNILMKNKITKNYLGPYHSFGLFYSDKFVNGVAGVNTLGFELYLKKLHIDLGYSFYFLENDYLNKRNVRGFSLQIGYAFNLESFRKKK